MAKRFKNTPAVCAWMAGFSPVRIYSIAAPENANEAYPVAAKRALFDGDRSVRFLFAALAVMVTQSRARTEKYAVAASGVSQGGSLKYNRYAAGSSISRPMADLST